MTSRTMLISPAADEMERLFLQDARFSVIHTRTESRDAYPALYTLCPDLLILDERPDAEDALSLLTRLRTTLATPPRVLYLSQEEINAKAAAEAGADLTRAGMPRADTLLSLAAQTADLPVPGLARETEQSRLAFADELLDQLRVPDNLKGREYMRFAAAMAACAPTLLSSLKYALYPLLSARYGASAASMERCIRTAVEATWLSGDLSGIHRLFGFSVDAEKGKPTNLEFLSMLAEHVRRKTNHMLLNSAE